MNVVWDVMKHREAGWAASPSALMYRGAGGARIALHTEFLPSLLSSEGAFSSISDSLLQEKLSGGRLLDLQTIIESLKD